MSLDAPESNAKARLSVCKLAVGTEIAEKEWGHK